MLFLLPLIIIFYNIDLIVLWPIFFLIWVLLNNITHPLDSLKDIFIHNWVSLLWQIPVSIFIIYIIRNMQNRRTFFYFSFIRLRHYSIYSIHSFILSILLCYIGIIGYDTKLQLTPNHIFSDYIPIGRIRSIIICNIIFILGHILETIWLEWKMLYKYKENSTLNYNNEEFLLHIRHEITSETALIKMYLSNIFDKQRKLLDWIIVIDILFNMNVKLSLLLVGIIIVYILLVYFFKKTFKENIDIRTIS